MNPVEFDIIFRGDIVIGHQLQDVKQRLQQLFKVDAAKVDSLFIGRPVPLKRNITEATANQYRDALLKAGAHVEICPSGSVRTSAPAPQAKPKGLSLAPVGTYLLTPVERPKVSPILIDTSAISLRPVGGNLLDVSEVSHANDAGIEVPDFELAEVGADLVREDERLSLPVIEIAGEEFELADVGADLLTPEERPKTAAVLPVTDFGLAPTGSDLGQLKPNIQPVTPDISQISLAD